MQASTDRPLTLAVLIPCYNEGLTIAATVAAFQKALPSATIYVYDNNSSDQTIEAAASAGAVVRREPRQGKGEVVRRMFADIDADLYVLVDGDGTYSAPHAPQLVDLAVEENLDFVNGARIADAEKAYRPGHRFGNRLLTGMVASIFGRHFSDMLSGYKVVSRRFAKSFPSTSRGFELETELTVHALELRMPCAEIATPYAERPEGSFSKLSTYRDGFRIVTLIVNLVKQERPLAVFGLAGLVLIVVAAIASVPLIETYLETGMVPRIPTAILIVGLTILGVLSAFAGLILDMVTVTRREMKRLIYLNHPSVRQQLTRGRKDR